MAAGINVIGIGPGGLDYLTPAAIKAVEESDVLVGGERNIGLFNVSGRDVFIIKNNLPEMLLYLKEIREYMNVAVLASGDPGLYGILSYLRNHFEPHELRVIPGISTVQYACARLTLPWHDAVVVSTHGRDRDKLIEEAGRRSKVVALAGPGEPPSDLARSMIRAGIGGKRVYVCSELSYDNEKIECFSLPNLVAMEEGWSNKNYIMVILDE